MSLRKPTAVPSRVPTAKPTVEPSLSPTVLPTFVPTNSSQLVITSNSQTSGIESKVTSFLLSPGGNVSLGVFVILLILITLICTCERSLAAKALAERQANSEKIKAERLKASGNATRLIDPTSSSSRKYSTSPFRKVSNFFAPRKYNMDDLETIL